MLKKCIAIFMVFFLGTSVLIAVDRSCSETTGRGGNSGLAVTKTEDGKIGVSFFGLEGKL